MFENSIRHALYMTCIFSGTPLLAIVVTGLVTSFIQSGLQLQEQSLSFVIKLSTLALCIYLFGSIGLSKMIELFHTFIASSLNSAV